MRSKRAISIISGAEIPSVPNVLQEILTIASDPNSSGKDMERAILKEPGLVTHLLKTVNSAVYSLTQDVTSINQAVVILGFMAVKSLASGLALIDAFNNIPGLNKDYVLALWKQSLASAGMIRLLARDATASKKDDLFLAAMVQNVGHLVLSQYFQNKYDALIKDTPFPSITKEQTLFQVDHSEAGAELLTAWRFPERTVELVRHHHNQDEYQGEPRDIHLLRTSNLLACESANLNTLMDQDESAISDNLLSHLKNIDWDWNQIQEEREDLVSSADQAQQIITA